MTVKHKIIRKREKLFLLIKFNPAFTLSLGFLSLILFGTSLLMLPFATEDRHHLTFIDALFEATSAVCVTGLVVVDTQTTFTLFGQIVIMSLIQIGGLGFMTIGIMIALLLGKYIGLQSRLLIQESLNQLTLGGMVRLVKFVLIFTLLTEGIGAIILSIRWANEYGMMKSIYYGIFHSISAFNNAGFDLIGNFSSMTKYVGDYTIVLTLSSLFIIGGLGFTVIMDIINKKSLKKLRLQTKIVIIMTVALNALGTLFIFALEYNNPNTLGVLPLKDQLLGAYFHGVVPRTAGFNTLSMPDLTLSSQLVTMFLMFIGGASGGTAGGIKVTTFAVILLAIWSVIKKQNNVNVMGRQISKEIIYRAFAIAVYSAGIVGLIVFLLTITEDAPLNVLLFEVISAFGTVGVTLNFTPELTTIGKALIAITMFIGRVGPLTIAFALASGKKQQTIKYTEEKIMIG